MDVSLSRQAGLHPRPLHQRQSSAYCRQTDFCYFLLNRSNPLLCLEHWYVAACNLTIRPNIRHCVFDSATVLWPLHITAAARMYQSSADETPVTGTYRWFYILPYQPFSVFFTFLWTFFHAFHGQYYTGAPCSIALSTINAGHSWQLVLFSRHPYHTNQRGNIRYINVPVVRSKN